MSRIDELIAEHCPEGVEFKELGGLLERTTNIRWQDVQGDEFKYIDLTSVDRHTHVIGDTEIIDSETAPSRAQQIVREGDVVFGTTRPMLKRYCLIPPEYDGQICSTGYCVLRPKTKFLLPNYLFHLLGAENFYNYVEANQRGASYPAITDGAVKAFRIPVPPLEVQREIVNVLDTFTQLEAELEAELEARRRQYQHYRNALLSFDKPDDMCWTALSTIAEITIGEFVHKNKQDPSAEYPVYNGGTSPTGFYDKFNNTGNKIIMSARGANAGFINRISVPYWAGNSCYSIGVTEGAGLNGDFAYHFLKQSQKKFIEEQQKGGIPAVSKKQVEDFLIPLPPLEEQARIVAILDKFDALVNDISIGLPAEIAARRQQYEHYRDSLLTFKEAA